MDRNIEQILKTMVKVEEPDAITVAQILNKGDAILVANEFLHGFLWFKHTTYAIKYVMYCIGNKLYMFSVKDTKNYDSMHSDEPMVLTLATVFAMDKESFGEILYGAYLKDQDALLQISSDLLSSLEKKVCIANKYTLLNTDIIKFIEDYFVEDPKCICQFEAPPAATGWNK